MPMTDKKDESSKAAGEPSSPLKPSDTGRAGDPKRPHATIDLKATEIKPASDAKSGDVKPSDVKAAGTKAGETKSADGKPTDPKTASAALAGKAADESKPFDARVKAAQNETAPAPRAKGASIGSTLTHLVAGLVGGGMAWYGATTLGPEYGLVPSISDPKTIALEAKLATLEKSITGTAATASGDLAAKVAALQGQLAKLDPLAKSVADLNASQTRIVADTQALAQKATDLAGDQGPATRVAKLEQQLKLMTEAAGEAQPGKLPQIAALSGRLVDLEATLTNQLSALRKTVSQEVEQRLSLTNETSEAAKSGTNRIDRDMAAVKSDAAATAQKIDKLRSDTDRLTAAIQGIRDANNEIKIALDGVKSDVEAKFKATAKPADVASAVAPVAGKLTALEQNVQSVVKSEEDRKLNAERILLSLELNNLKRVIDRGQKYATELTTVKKAAGPKDDLTVLERYKDTGISTLADLSREFGPVANAILDGQADTGDGSVIGRMLASARSVVAIRKINYAATDKSAEAVVGRMEQALRDGNIAGVLDEAKNIPVKPGASQDRAVQDWLVKVEARGAVDRAISALEASLKTSLTGGAAAAPK